MLLLSWNVAGRVRALDEQAANVLALGADFVCLQETTPTTLPLWSERLREAGYHVEHANTQGSARARPLVVLTASRVAGRVVPVAGAPWPERVLSTTHENGFTLVNVHSPTSPKPELAKVRTHLAVHRHLAVQATHPRILCGDLNTPRREHRDGTIWTFARDRYGRLRPDRGEEWDRAERALLLGLTEFGFVDAFRELHGYEEKEISWGWRRWAGGYRLDHLILSEVDVRECRYEHAWRTEGLSDHSALVAELDARPRRKEADPPGSS